MRTFRDVQHDRFLQALEQELIDLPEDFTPTTVYLGGGTPTELPPQDLARIFDALERHLDLSRMTELSCEANPGTLDQQMADLLIARGVNRVSLGVQSFLDERLQALGRIHSAQEAREGVELLRKAGCKNLSVDLLFGLPDAGEEEIEPNVEAIAALQPDHVSWYSLEFEPGTAFTDMRDKGFLQSPTEERIEAEYGRIRTGLADLGYEQYELFSFTRPGKECQHNLNYWRGGEFHGVGPSAHSHVKGQRWRNRPDLDHYGTQDAITESREQLPLEQKARETLMTALRITEGVSLSEFETRTGCAIPELLGDHLRIWETSGWIRIEGDRMRLTPDAYLISDHLFREFV